MEDPNDALVFHVEGGRVRTEVDLVQDDRLRASLETCPVRRQLAIDDRETLVGVVFGRIDHVQQQICTLQMSEELVSEADALARALDQPGHVGHR